MRWPSTTTHVPVGTSCPSSPSEASTMTWRLPAQLPSLISRNAKASLSAFRPVLTQPPTRAFLPAKPDPPSGREMMERIRTRSEKCALGTSSSRVAAASWSVGGEDVSAIAADGGGGGGRKA